MSLYICIRWKYTFSWKEGKCKTMPQSIHSLHVYIHISCVNYWYLIIIIIIFIFSSRVMQTYFFFWCIEVNVCGVFNYFLLFIFFSLGDTLEALFFHNKSIYLYLYRFVCLFASYRQNFIFLSKRKRKKVGQTSMITYIYKCMQKQPVSSVIIHIQNTLLFCFLLFYLFILMGRYLLI